MHLIAPEDPRAGESAEHIQHSRDTVSKSNLSPNPVKTPKPHVKSNSWSRNCIINCLRLAFILSSKMKLTGLALNQAPRLFCPNPLSTMFQRRSHSLASAMFYRTAGIVDLDRRNFRTSQTLFLAQRGPNYYCKFTQNSDHGSTFLLILCRGTWSKA